MVSTSSKPRGLPELLAPAGDWECARAAVENGADAIYFGLDRFNARMRARNFTESDLPALMEFLHRRGVRGYVTFNTLVFADELPEALQYLRSLIAAGVDAAIVQDIGMCRLIRKLSPDFPIHGSTQMTVTSPAGVAFARELGCQLVVLARENSIREIEAIQKAQGYFEPATPAIEPLPLEVFVHGALCVAYSGQCLTSESLGGRSANRGECAQACRMPYELISDGNRVELGDRRYLLSPQDLAGLEILPDLVKSGVASLKIEGRLKAPEYVASVTRVYREALDRLKEERVSSTTEPADNRPASTTVERADKYELEMAFSRGLYTGWFGGVNNQELVHGRFAKKRGVFLGEIVSTRGRALVVRLVAPLKSGDGVVVDTGTGDDHEQGGRVVAIQPQREGALITFFQDSIDPQRVHPGDRLWKTNDPALDREIRRTFEGDKIRFQRPIHFEVHGALGTPLTLIARDQSGHVARVESTIPLVQAERQPLTTETLSAQLGRLGGTPFKLGELANHLEGECMLPVSELNRLRRDVATELERQNSLPLRWQLNPSSLECLLVEPAAPESTLPKATTELIAVVRSIDQLEAALLTGVATFYCEFEDPKKYRDAVRIVREQVGCSDAPKTVWVMPPRIFKPGEDWILKQVRSSDADGYLVRNYDHLTYFADCRIRGDFSLNVANPLTAEYFIRKYRLERVTASYDLNSEQLVALLDQAPASWFEVTLHQHMPMFHMEHCVFCTFLSNGTN
jgi:putative protease